MSDVHSKLMRSLIEEHACGRKTVNGSESAERACIIDETESSQNIKVVEGVGRVFSHAIEREQGQFFHQCMQYLSKQELENTLQEFSDFDRKMMHTKHQQIVEKMENDR